MTPEAFERRVDKSGECWRWTGNHNWAGYGTVWLGSRTTGRNIAYAHRVAYEMAFGPIPPRGCILHSCDVRDCVRPEHLRLGTRAENSADMVARGRSRKGETHSQAILSDLQVEAIRVLLSAGWTQKRVADTFGVVRSTISLIATGARRVA